MILTPRLELLIATRNSGKIREIQAAMRFAPVKLRYLDEFPNVLPVAEVGRTYQENATLKALGYSRQTGVYALADDSGLEVDALGGIPGVLSARFAGESASNAKRIHKLLTALLEYSGKERSARFVCCMALAGWQPAEASINDTHPAVLSVTEGRCEGVIGDGPRGLNGFGFDPVFIPMGHNATFAELPPEVKASISHRALALRAMRQFLNRWLAPT